MLSYENKSRTCCFTGHRPQKLHQAESEIREGLDRAVARACEDGYRFFITGMAMGVDLWAGEAVVKLKAKHPDVSLIAAVPYAGQEKHFPPEWKKLYAEVLSACDHTEVLAQEYRKGVFAFRDRWMVDHSSRIIAVYNGEPGGTLLTLSYAKKEGLELRGIE